MGLFVLAPIFGFVLPFWYFMWDDWKPSKGDRPFKYNGFWASTGLSALICLLALIFGMLIALLIGSIATACGAETEILTQETRNLYALADGDDIHGHFFLGSGTIDENMKYVYIVETEGKGYKMESIGIHSAYIQYVDEQPTLTKTVYIFESDILNFFGVCDSTEYLFRIPEGSITNSYVINLE